MKLIDRIAEAARIITNTKLYNQPLVPTANKDRVMYRIKKELRYTIDVSIESYNAAIDQARHVYRPRRVALISLYKKVMRDNHLNSAIRKRRAKILVEQFVILGPKGQKDERKTKLLQRPWFVKLVKYWVDTEFYGHSLVEFGDIKNGEFTDIHLVPRENVIPDEGKILLSVYTESTIPYREKPVSDYLIEIGDPDYENLGLLENLAPEVIIKKLARSDWSRHSEKYGMPIVHIQTSQTDQKEIDRYVEMGQNLGRDGVIITDDSTIINTIGEKQTDPFKIYEGQIMYADNQISKGVSGETGTSDEKSFVGSAEVHERILNELGLSDLLHFYYFMNYTVMPFLRVHGYPFQKNDEFIWQRVLDEESRKSASEAAREALAQNLTPPEPSAPDGEKGNRPDYEKKKFEWQQKNLLEIINKIIQDVFDKKLQPGDLDAGLWSWLKRQLSKAVSTGFGTTLTVLEPMTLSYTTLRKLIDFQSVFAAHKTQKFIQELVLALSDDEGNIVSFSKFKKAALQIHSQWNGNWYRAEYQQSVAAGQMASQWVEIQRDKDLFPHLKYVTVGDNNVRPEHVALDGIVKHVDDPFWDIYFPPNGWGCRCTVISTDEDEPITPAGELLDLPVPPEENQHNVGKTGQVFSMKHPYFQETTQEDRDKINEFLDQNQ